MERPVKIVIKRCVSQKNTLQILMSSNSCLLSLFCKIIPQPLMFEQAFKNIDDILWKEAGRQSCQLQEKKELHCPRSKFSP